jgi:hypothetical protein
MFYKLCWKIKSTFYEIKEYFVRQYYIHKKAYYECCVCKHLVAPYFDDRNKFSLTDDMGWCKLKGKPKKWLCHHCSEHGYCLEGEENKYPCSTTWKDWQEGIVQYNRERVLKLIKEKDFAYYDKYFNYKVPYGDKPVLINFDIIPKENNND